MSHKETDPNSTPRHLSVVPPLEIQPKPDISNPIFSNNEPEQPEDVTLRLDGRALNLLRALAKYDNTNPAEQIRIATTLYLKVRLGDKAVAEFITSREKQLNELYALLERGPNNESSQNQSSATD